MAATARAATSWRTVVLLCGAAVFISYIDRTNLSVAAIPMQQAFGWSETTKGWVLSSFFIGYLLFMAASGVLANRFGGRKVLGAAVLWWSAFTALTPPAAMVSLPVLMAARIALGMGEAAVFPASVNMLARWVPAQHRSRASAFFISTLSLGAMVSLPVTGWLVRDFGWPLPFYAFGAMGLVWAVAWYALTREGRSEAEASHEPRSIPWRRLVRSSGVWALTINHFCSNWVLYVLLSWLPSYFKTTFNVSLTNAGLMAAAPWAAYFVMANIAGWAADALLARGRSATFVRRLMQCTALLGSAAFMIAVQYASSATMGLVLLCGAAGALGLCLAGFGSNAFDLSPRYADVIWGISNTGGTLPGVFGVAITGWLVDRTGNYAAPFLLTAALAVGGALVFLFFGSGERQVD